LGRWIAELEVAGEWIRIDKHLDRLTKIGSLLYQSHEQALHFEKSLHGWRSVGLASMQNWRLWMSGQGVSDIAFAPSGGLPVATQ
jgi:hypothetical protein